MSVSEGQPAHTPEERGLAEFVAGNPGEMRLVRAGDVAAVLAELAREREARKEQERATMDVAKVAREFEKRCERLAATWVEAERQVSELRGQVAREREAREQDAERHEADVEAAEAAWNHLTAKLEGRVRELQEAARELLASIHGDEGHYEEWQRVVQARKALEALVGLPE